MEETTPPPGCPATTLYGGCSGPSSSSNEVDQSRMAFADALFRFVLVTERKRGPRSRSALTRSEIKSAYWKKEERGGNVHSHLSRPRHPDHTTDRPGPLRPLQGLPQPSTIPTRPPHIPYIHAPVPPPSVHLPAVTREARRHAPRVRLRGRGRECSDAGPSDASIPEENVSVDG